MNFHYRRRLKIEGQAVGENGNMFPIRALVVGKSVQASWRILNKFLLYCSLCIDYDQFSKQFQVQRESQSSGGVGKIIFIVIIQIILDRDTFISSYMLSAFP